MAQEINEELGRCLRERGLIGEALDGVEKKTKLKREQVVYGVVAVICLLFLINALGAKAAVFISTVWPMLGSIRAIDRADVAALQKWTAYWIMYALINVLFNFIFIGIHRYFKRIFFVKLLLLAWCAAPMQANGANIIFQKCLAGKIFKEGSLLPPMMGGGGLPPPMSGGKKDGSPDNSRKMKK
ncbi:hypothetical protein HPB47_022842 [Ixodes persulcatus]|uniref:Uncharacterized protein n=1 Tax=Ixodes persulcatus TaxID=34615 RepID=A0AC60Q938_IXOPE|nr:hypothetical protein HPB47_022842 [Ixodes persulcatus]